MSHPDLKIQALERQVNLLKEQVQRMTLQLAYLDRERVRTKNEISQVISEVRSRRG